MAQKPNYFDLTGDVSATSTSSISVPNDVAIQASRRKAESEKKREQEKQKKKDEDYKNFLERKEAGELNAIELLSSDEEEEENLVVPSAATKRAKSKSSAPGSRVADASYQRSPKHTLKEKTTTHFSNLAASSNPTSDGRKILSSAARHPGRSSSTLQEGVQQSLSQETPFRTKAATSSAISTPVKASSASSDFREDRSSSNFVDSDKRSQKRTERQALHSTVSPQMVESGSSSRLLPSYQNELSPHRETVRSPRSNVTAKLNFGEALQTRSTSEKIANLSTEGDNVKHLSVETLPPVTLEDPVETGSSMGSKMLSTSKESSGASKLQDHESPFPTVGHRGKPHLKRDAESHALLTPALTPAPLSEHAESLDQLQEEAMPIPLHVENVERLLSRHRETLKEHQEALLTSNFARAEQQHRTFAGPAIYRSKPSPFQKLIAQKMTTDISTKGGRQESLIIQTACARSKPEKKTLTAHLDVSQFASNGQYVPKVKSIGRLGASRDILARNVHTLTYMPWFPENETDTATAEEKKRYEEVEGRYNNNIKTRALMRRCRAIANMWQPEVERMMEQLGISCGDIVYYMLHTDENEQPTEGTLSPPMLELWNDRAEDCPSCEVSEYCRSSEYTRIAPLLRRPSTERRLAMAGLFCEVFYRIVKVNLWHVISQMESTIQIYQDCMDRIDKRPEAQRNDLSTFCYACGQFSCTIHGAFHSEEEDMNADNSMEATSSSPPARCTGSESFSDDDSKSEASPEGEVVLDDVELNLNIREHATIPLRPARQRSTEQHLCGAFCVDLGTRVKDIVGLHLNGKVSGAMRADLCSEDSPPFDDLTPCDSDVCFWTVRNRSDTVLDLSRSKFNGFLDTADGRLYQSLLPIAFTSKRGPCELAFAISSSTCLEIFCFMLCSIRSSPHLGGMKPSTPSKKTETIVDLSSDKHLEDRINFVPCSHSGTCQLDVCACVAGTISCESSCGCSAACSRRFKGCSCRDGRRKVCFEDTRCECWANNRECDPALCGACGVQEVLDPANRDSSEFNHCCRNNRIQLGIPRRTVMGVSEVHGWGLFAGEYIPRSEFISEYKGELISISEGDRRGAVYHNLGLEYLFKLSHDQELDGSRFSNKSRFINNSSVSRNINVFSKKMLCNGVSRIMLYSARDILAGEELFYNYGYDKDVREHFKEKPDLTKKPTLPRTLSTTASFTTPSIASGTALSEPVGSVMSFTNTALDFDELEEESAPPISEPDSEFEGSASDELTGDASDDDEDDEVEAEAEDGARINLQNILAPSTGLRRPKSKDGPSGRPVARPNLYALPDSLEERPRKKAKRWNLSQIRQPQAQAQGSDSDIPLRRRTLSRTQSNDKPADEPEVHPKRVPINQRKRSISVNDKRLGGDAQRKAAQTLKARRAMQAAREAEKSSGAVGGKKRKRSDTLSSPSKEPSSPQPLMFRLTQPNMVAIGGAGLSKTATPESRPRALTRSPQFSSDAASASMSVSSRSASPAKQVSPQMVAQNGSLASSWSK